MSLPKSTPSRLSILAYIYIIYQLHCSFLVEENRQTNILPLRTQLLGVHSGAPRDQVDGDKRCTDSNGVPRTSSAVDAGISTSSAVDLPRCFDDDTPGRVWWWWVFSVYVFYGLHAFGMLYTACLPLRYGDEGYRLFETMTYRRRLMAVTTLWGVSACFICFDTN